MQYTFVGFFRKSSWKGPELHHDIYGEGESSKPRSDPFFNAVMFFRQDLFSYEPI